MSSPKLEREEQELLESFERGEWSSLRARKAELSRLGTAARATLRKNKRINIRLSDRDLIGLQAKAAEEGMPYQTLISSVLHKYLTGSLQLVDTVWQNKAAQPVLKTQRVSAR